MVRASVVFLLVAACGGSESSDPRPAPSEDVLCQVWAGNGKVTASQMGLPGWGSLSTDVIAAWGEPSERDGDVWTYEWTTGGRAVSVTLTFEAHEVCLNGKRMAGDWLAGIEPSGIASKPCWKYDLRKDEETCDGCLDHGEVGECL